MNLDAVTSGGSKCKEKKPSRAKPWDTPEYLEIKLERKIQLRRLRKGERKSRKPGDKNDV